MPQLLHLIRSQPREVVICNILLIGIQRKITSKFIRSCVRRTDQLLGRLQILAGSIAHMGMGVMRDKVLNPDIARCILEDRMDGYCRRRTAAGIEFSPD